MKNDFNKTCKAVLKSQRGFNLIEVLVAMMLISIVLFSICSLLVYSSGSMSRTKGQTETTLRLYGLAELVNALSAQPPKSNDSQTQHLSPVTNALENNENGIVIRSNSECKKIEASGNAQGKFQNIKETISAWYDNAVQADQGEKVSFYAIISKSDLRNIAGQEFSADDGSAAAASGAGPYIAEMTIFRMPSGTYADEFHDGCAYIGGDAVTTSGAVASLRDKIADSVKDRAKASDAKHLSEGTYSTVVVMLGH